jgi:hypothetical protein
MKLTFSELILSGRDHTTYSINVDEEEECTFE